MNEENELLVLDSYTVATVREDLRGVLDKYALPSLIEVALLEELKHEILSNMREDYD